MRHPLRALALACALAATPACASAPLGDTRLEDPVAAARTLDQRAYALLSAYAAVIEEAADIVRDPDAPAALKRALGQAERAATPAAEALELAVAAYVRARAEAGADAEAGQPAPQRVAALADAARRLSDALAAAQAPVAGLEQLVRARRG